MLPADIHQRLRREVRRSGSRPSRPTPCSPGRVVASDAIARGGRLLQGRPDLGFDNLMCLSAVDYPKADAAAARGRLPPLVLPTHPRVRPEGPRAARGPARCRTVESVWGVANWHEREAYDLMGITFDGHPTCGASCCPTTGSAIPLRKDYVDPDYYHGVHVKPTPQMAERSMAGEKIAVGRSL